MRLLRGILKAFIPSMRPEKSNDPESEHRKIYVDPIYKECIDILTEAETDPNFIMKSKKTSIALYDSSCYFKKYVLQRNGEIVIQALIKHVDRIYDQLRMLTYKGNTYQNGYIIDSIDSDTQDRLTKAFMCFDNGPKTQAQQDFENAAKEFEHLVCDAKKAGTLRVNQETKHGTPVYDILDGRNLEWCDTTITYTVLINGKYIGMCNDEGKEPKFGSYPFNRLMKFKGNVYKEEKLNFNCFGYSMLLVHMRQWQA